MKKEGEKTTCQKTTGNSKKISAQGKCQEQKAGKRQAAMSNLLKGIPLNLKFY